MPAGSKAGGTCMGTPDVCKVPAPPYLAEGPVARVYLGGAHFAVAIPTADGRLQIGWVIRKGAFGELKRRGERPLLIARGGMESHGREVLRTAAQRGLKVRELHADARGGEGLVRALRTANSEDIVHLATPVDPEARRVLFRSADAVLFRGRAVCGRPFELAEARIEIRGLHLHERCAVVSAGC